MARLDRLSAAKQVAQTGATLGREFSYALIEAVADIDIPMLRNGLEQLVAAEILYQRGTPPDSSYTFKHALLQDTAYESQLKTRRRALHARTAAILEERFPQRVAAEPEVMARHCAEGSLVDQAISYYEKAGQQAIARVASPEAVDYFGRALEQLSTLPADGERHQREIGLRLLQIGPLTGQRGYDDLDVVGCRSRIEALCEELDSGPQRLPALLGLSIYNMGRGDLPRARGHAEALLGIAEPLEIAPLQVAGHAILGSASLTSATISQAKSHIKRAIDIASSIALPPPATAFDLEPLTVAHSLYGIALVLDGRPEASVRSFETSLERAREIDHLHTLGSCLYNAAVISYFLDDPAAARSWGDETLATIEGRGFHTPESGAHVYRGWARVLQGDRDGFAEVEAGLELAGASGSLGGLVQLYLTAADAFQALGGFERAEHMLIESIEGAEGWHGYQSPWMELRSVMLLGRLALRTGRREDARVRLSPLYAGFTEGFGTKRLRDAKALLQELE